MDLTIVSHFYNEEYLLPWWCKHHKRICKNAIMIDYGSTDKSVEIIKEICPHWKVVKTANPAFDAPIVDREVEFYENQISGWRLALNTTEFLYGNVKQLENITEPCQKFLGNYVFIDVHGNFILDKNKTLHDQCFMGYREKINRIMVQECLYRVSRSIHNKPIMYPKEGGRHYSDPPSFNDLYIFYYGFCSLDNNMIARKMQIKTKMSENQFNITKGEPNNTSWEDIVYRLKKYHHEYVENVYNDVKWLSSYNY